MAFDYYTSKEQLEEVALKMIPEFIKGKPEEKLINLDVLKFIAMFTNCDASDYRDSTTQLFQGGLCYYFAVLLKNEFSGSIVFRKFGGHIAWQDNTGFIYDSFGLVFDYNKGDWLPVELMDKIELDGFKHIEFHDRDEYNQALLNTAMNILSYERSHNVPEYQLLITNTAIKLLKKGIKNKEPSVDLYRSLRKAISILEKDYTTNVF